MPRARALITLPVVLALPLAAGCGSEEETVVRRPAIRVTLDDYSISPQDISVRPGDRLPIGSDGKLKLKLIATNRGRLTHNLKIQVPPKDPGDRPEAITGTAVAQPGEKVTQKIALRPGTYRLICTLANHDDLGQYGKLVVHGK